MDEWINRWMDGWTDRQPVDTKLLEDKVEGRTL